eukprot:CAMPEP_0168808124 /NCGR_PEP_ID=MMETSP0726-20121227/2412_1 /TAXON_ID=265536 /ORGANISM="Amphiprora sp., Strain CCMP467" /LENGTH=385 /DNA_ID=CAMNT_0008860075 /DNA_START=27 /DNA_END=1180 /DNA_ORIENTATION=-
MRVLLALFLLFGFGQAVHLNQSAAQVVQWEFQNTTALATPFDLAFSNGTTAAQRRLQKKQPAKKNTCAGLPKSHRSQNVISIRRRGRVRQYRIITPPKYNSRVRSKVILYFHGLGETSSSFANDAPWAQAAARNNYIVVAPDGIQRSWQFPGSADGRGRDGSITTCDTNRAGPNKCFAGCSCPKRCGWTQCQDDDLLFVLDLIRDIRKRICVDNKRIYAVGISNGAMLTWSMAQDPKIAPRLAGIAPMIGTPHPDYLQGKPTAKALPSIGFYGDRDNVIPPGNYQESRVMDTAFGGYYWIPAHRLHTQWARDHGCSTPNPNARAPFVYRSGNQQGISVQCRTFCQGNKPMSVDCRLSMGHETPAFMLTMAIEFFEKHSPRRNRNA